jgi:hypothetical protein
LVLLTPFPRGCTGWQMCLLIIIYLMTVCAGEDLIKRKLSNSSKIADLQSLVRSTSGLSESAAFKLTFIDKAGDKVRLANDSGTLMCLRAFWQILSLLIFIFVDWVEAIEEGQEMITIHATLLNSSPASSATASTSSSTSAGAVEAGGGSGGGGTGGKKPLPTRTTLFALFDWRHTMAKLVRI